MSPFSWTAAEPSDTPLAAAYLACARLVRQHDRFFAVRSRLLPPDARPHVAAIYAFAAAAGDFAEEGEHSNAERECLLDDWLHRLRAAARGESGDDPASVFAAVGHTVRTHQLPLQLFEDVIGGLRQNVLTRRYGTWNDLQDYCRRAANPVGRLVLRVTGHDDPGLDRASDALTTALELTNRWRNLAGDWAKGRLYVPREDLDGFGARETDLDEARISRPWRAVLAAMAGRTRALFAEGRQLCDGVTGRLRLDLRVSWLRGMMVLDRLERSGFDVFGSRPALGVVDVPVLLWRTARWRPSV